MCPFSILFSLSNSSDIPLHINHWLIQLSSSHQTSYFIWYVNNTYFTFLWTAKFSGWIVFIYPYYLVFLYWMWIQSARWHQFSRVRRIWVKAICANPTTTHTIRQCGIHLYSLSMIQLLPRGLCTSEIWIMSPGGTVWLYVCVWEVMLLDEVDTSNLP